MAETVMTSEAELKELAHETARLKDVITDAVEDGMHAARRAMKRGRYAAEDALEEAAHEVKEHPLASVGTAALLAFGTGLAVGWIACRLRGR